MKKQLRIGLIVIIIIGLLGYLGWGVVSKVQVRRETAERVAHLPPFRFQAVNGQVVTPAQTGEKPLWLMFFHADCEFCQMEAQHIRQQGQQLQHLSIWLVSPEPIDTLRAFGRRFGLDSLPNVKLLHATNHDHLRTFGIRVTPTSLLYSPDGSLIKQFNGVVKPEAVAKLTQ